MHCNGCITLWKVSSLMDVVCGCGTSGDGPGIMKQEISKIWYQFIKSGSLYDLNIL